MSKIVKSQIFDSQNAARARERSADGVSRMGKDSLIISRY
jgi:hypothetical protein